MTSRRRFTLEDKKCCVDKYKALKFECFRENLKNGTMIKDISIKEFCVNNKIKKDSMFCAWLRMDSLGQFESWDGKNNLKLFNFRPKYCNILHHINEGLFLFLLYILALFIIFFLFTFRIGVK